MYDARPFGRRSSHAVRRFREAFLVALLSLIAATAFADGTIRGTVRSASGTPLGNARVWLIELGRTTTSGADGAFTFEDIPSGSYELLAESELQAVASASVRVEDDGVHELDLVVDDEAVRFAESVSVTGRSDEMIRIASSAAEGVTGQRDLAMRPIQRPGDLLETVPGMVATQHSGGGKANQYFVRGFNLDHGTDFRLTMEGVPVNMPSHGHGQGYADLNFLIPELVERVDYRKGPYYAEEGDFSAAGAAHFTFFDRLVEPFLRVSGGEFGQVRAVAGGSTRVGGGDLLGAFDVGTEDGPWERPNEFRRLSGLLRFTRRNNNGGFRLSGQFYDGDWSSTDQIPQRAVERGDISRFGFIDPTDAGSSSRHSVWGEWWRTGASSVTSVQAYGLLYDMTLFSNFTYFLADPVNGDQFEQLDDRTAVGATLRHSWFDEWGGHSTENVVGFDLRHDWIDNGLFSTREQVRLSTTREDSIGQLGGAPFVQNRTNWTDWLRTTVGLRADFYRVDVTSDEPRNSGTRSAGLVSPKLSVVFGPFETTEIYGNFGGGYHSNDARGATLEVDPTTGEPAEPVDPLVRAWGFDVGARTRVARRFSTAVTVFRLDLDSELLFVGDGGATEASRPSRRTGVEWSNYFEPTDWLKLDLDVAFTRGRFDDDDPDDRIPGAMETVVATGLTVDSWRGFVGTLRYRYFGPKPLTEDGAVRARASNFVTARLGYRFEPGVEIGVDVLNLFDTEANDIDYFYESRLPGEPAAGVGDVHFHPLTSRAVRLFLDWRF